MKWLDSLTESSTRSMARRTSRRSLLASIGSMLMGAASIPLLPVARGAAAAEPEKGKAGASDDHTSCDYWRHCAIDGFLCGCCGGTQNQCPPGTEMSLVTWIGTCQNPTDGKHYAISYNDCCGFKNACNRCECMRNESDTPPYRPSTNNDINWCLGTSTNVYHCSTAVLLGVALEDGPRAQRQR